MDISKPIKYRGLDINGVTLQTGRTLSGIAVESVDYSSIDTVGYTEKRAGSDGMHASDVYLGGRIVDMGGHIYASSLNEAFDFLHVMRATFSPTSAYQQSPGDRGFLPLEFQQGTNDVGSFPGDLDEGGTLPPGIVPLYMNVRPMDSLKFSIQRDRQDNSRAVKPRPTAIPWATRLLAKDPRVYIDPPQIKDLAGGPHAATDAYAINRGDYETPLNIILNMTAATAGSFHITGFGGVDMTIKIEAKANTVYRWFGDDRVLMTQDVSGGVTTRPYVLRMDLVSFIGLNRKPMVPASINMVNGEFQTKYTYSSTVVLGPTSRLFWNEAFA